MRQVLRYVRPAELPRRRLLASGGHCSAACRDLVAQQLKQWFAARDDERSLRTGCSTAAA